MKSATALDRRTFISQTSRAALLLPFLGAGIFASCGRASSFLADAKKNQPGEEGVSWEATIVSEKEPGEPLIVSGVIFAPDGRTPLEGINLFVYQTDATGRYSTSGGDNRNTRIHGLMRTNAAGRYRFRTIKPASYPATRNPAHIHAYVSGPGYPEYWIDEYLFDDDPFVTVEQRQKVAGQGNFSSVLKLTRGSDGVLQATRDIKIERCSRNCTGR